jgi:hypothetical protein
MRDLVILFIHLLVTIARLLGPGGARAVIADNATCKTPASDNQPFTNASAAPTVKRPNYCWTVRYDNAPDPCATVGNRLETFDDSQLSPSIGET